MPLPRKPPIFCARGSALFLVLIAIALFAALSYAATRSSRGGGGGIGKEKAMLDAARAEQCVAYVERGVNMLRLVGGCSIDMISYELPDGSNANNQSPSDERCHVFRVNGAGLSACGPWLEADCDLQALANVGDKCENEDIVYVGTIGGERLYTTVVDQGVATYNKGPEGAHGSYDTGAVSKDDGWGNTNTLVALGSAGDGPYNAAHMCRALGAAWYLPARDELQVLYDARNEGVLSDTFTSNGESPAGGYPVGIYWSSSDEQYNAANGISFFTGAHTHDVGKGRTRPVRCMRRSG